MVVVPDPNWIVVNSLASPPPPVVPAVVPDVPPDVAPDVALVLDDALWAVTAAVCEEESDMFAIVPVELAAATDAEDDAAELEVPELAAEFDAEEVD